MTLVEAEGSRWLERAGERVPLAERDWVHFIKRTPLGRKVYFRRRAMELGEGGAMREAAILMGWARLPAREWETTD